jgi:hypothetical protein
VIPNSRIRCRHSGSVHHCLSVTMYPRISVSGSPSSSESSSNSQVQCLTSSVGAPAGGMNAATRQAVRFCHNRGHTPIAIYNGFDGLLDDNVCLNYPGYESIPGQPEVDLNSVQTEPSLLSISDKSQLHSKDTNSMPC